MTTDQKHIDAVASAGPWTCGGHIAGWCPIHDGKIRDGDAYCKEAILAARTVLDSTDPAVHAAMLDALTRHGVLTEERMPWTRGHHKHMRRHVTSWGGPFVTEVAP